LALVIGLTPPLKKISEKNFEGKGEGNPENIKKYGGPFGFAC
jgi:hypothetical protein